MDKSDFPIRINRYLYLSNICSRRQADAYIKQGKVRINGKVAVLGDKVAEKDKVTVSKDVRAENQDHMYIALNKPAGVVSHSPEHDEREASSLVPSRRKLTVLGRLDKASEGLLLLTSDHTIVDKMLNPRHAHEKEY